MNNIAVIYKSQYGSTKTYAKWIVEELNTHLFEVSQITPPQLMDYDMIIYGGGLYAGGIDGASLVAKNPCKNLVVFTVGIADPSVTDYTEINNKRFTKEQLSNIKIFHLRGGIVYKNLSFIHKIAMSVVKRQAAKTPEAKRTNDDKILLETYGKELDFTDKNTIAPMVTYVKEKLSI